MFCQFLNFLQKYIKNEIYGFVEQRISLFNGDKTVIGIIHLMPITFVAKKGRCLRLAFGEGVDGTADYVRSHFHIGTTSMVTPLLAICRSVSHVMMIPLYCLNVLRNFVRPPTSRS